MKVLSGLIIKIKCKLFHKHVLESVVRENKIYAKCQYCNYEKDYTERYESAYRQWKAFLDSLE
jgi:hypothetical protein